MKLSTILYQIAQQVENLEHKVNGTEVQLAQYANTGRQLPADVTY